MADPDAYAGLMLTRKSVVFRNEFPNAPSVRDRGTECTVHRAEHSRRREVAKPWYRARFGTERSRVRIPPSRPLTQHMGSPSRPQSRAGPANQKSARIDSGQKNGALKKFEEELILNAFLRALTWRGLWKSPELARGLGCYRRFGDGSADKSRTTGQSSSVARPSARSH